MPGGLGRALGGPAATGPVRPFVPIDHDDPLPAPLRRVGHALAIRAEHRRPNLVVDASFLTIDDDESFTAAALDVGDTLAVGAEERGAHAFAGGGLSGVHD